MPCLLMDLAILLVKDIVLVDVFIPISSGSETQA